MISLFNHSEPLALMPGGMPDITAISAVDQFKNSVRSGNCVISNGVAIIRLHGPVLRTLPAIFRSGLDNAGIEYTISPELAVDVTGAAQDPSVRAIVLDIDSPGGQVCGTPELAEAVSRAASVKPCYAYTSGLCASAAYWVASQCDAIYNSSSASVGSIGVLCALADYTLRNEQNGVRYNIIQAGKYKTAGMPEKKLSDDERDLFQERVDAIFAQFRSAVTARRPLEDSVMQGQVFYGFDAVTAGLSDALCNSLGEFVAKIRRRHC